MADPIHFPGSLPPGALVQFRQPAQPAPPQPSGDPAPLWLSADHAPGTGPLLHWPACAGTGTAHAVPANPGGTPRAPDGALRFSAGENSGLCLPAALPDAATASLAVIFRPLPGASGGTILSLQPQDGSGYLFLAHEEGQLRLGRKDGDLALSAPAPEGALLACLTLATGRLRLSINGGNTVTAQQALSGLADLFIGCRNARPGLKNKLGSFLLYDLLLWPGDPAPDLTAARALLAQRGQHGI